MKTVTRTYSVEVESRSLRKRFLFVDTKIPAGITNHSDMTAIDAEVRKRYPATKSVRIRCLANVHRQPDYVPDFTVEVTVDAATPPKLREFVEQIARMSTEAECKVGTRVCQVLLDDLIASARKLVK